ncbi:MAG: histidine phosphatase family protein [Pseudomonadota bacterium]
MAELVVVRHAQASFGAANYDQLSVLGHRQSELAGAALRVMGWEPDRLVTGTLVRQKETLRAMGYDVAPEEHSGFNEYDFHDLLRVRFGGQVPDPVMQDRKTHFRTLRDTILDWQAGGLTSARESFAEFTARVAAARDFACDTAARRVLVISSGGPIGQLVARALDAPAAQMMALNLQVRNTSITRFIFSGDRFYLNEFNALPHLSDAKHAELVSYS